MALEAWNDLSLKEKNSIRRGFFRNPHRAYEKLRAKSGDSSDSTPTPDPEPTKVVYGFTSYSDAEKTTEWGTGTVETTGETSGDYTEVEVLTNSTDESFIGQKFFIVSNAKTDGTVYELFTDAGTTSAGIFVTIVSSE